MATRAYFGQLEQNVNSLIADRKYNEAYQLCLNFLAKYPEEKKLLQLKEKVELEVERENRKIIKSRLKEIKPLWKAQKYPEILSTLKTLLKLSPKHRKLNKLALKAQKAYQEEVDLLQKQFYNEQNERLTEILNNSPDTLLIELQTLENANSGSRVVKKIIQEFKTKLIRKKIDEKQDLIYSDKYDAINNFIFQLKKIDDENQVIKELESLTRKRQHGSQIEEKNEFLYKGKKHLRTLMQLKKYDKVIKAATELLEVDKQSIELKNIIEKAEKKYYRQNKNKTAEQIIADSEQLKKEYKEKPSDFTKI